MAARREGRKSYNLPAFMSSSERVSETHGAEDQSENSRAGRLSFLPIWMASGMVPQGSATQHLTFVPALCLIPEPYFHPNLTSRTGGRGRRQEKLCVNSCFLCVLSSVEMHFQTLVNQCMFSLLQ